MENIPLEISDKILRFAVADYSANAERILKTDLSAVAALSTVCWDWNLLLNESAFWRDCCRAFPDFLILQKRQKSTAKSWKQICQDRITNTLIQKTVRVGDIENPSAVYLIQVNGCNQLNIFKEFTGHYRLLLNYDDSSIIKFNNKFFLDSRLHEFTPYRLQAVEHTGIIDSVNLFLLNSLTSELPQIQNLVIDVAVFDPIVLILTNTHQVLELMFVPELDQTGWQDMREPRFINFAPDVKIIRMFAFDVCNIAIDQNHGVWAWTVLDHPFPNPEILESMKKIRTKPVLLTALSSVKVVHCCPGIPEHTRMFWTSKDDADYDDFSENHHNNDLDFYDVPNIQIMAIIAEHTFSEQTLQRLGRVV